MNNAPFYIGQRVAALKTDNMEIIKKGEQFTVRDIFKCSRCGRWHITLEERPMPETGDFDCDCSKILIKNTNTHFGGCVKYFAPIDERTVSIPESLKEQAEEIIGVKETIKQPEKELV